MKAYLEYIAEIATENDPVNTILSVAELVRSQAEHSGKVAKLNMVSFLTMLRNAGLNIDFEGLTAYYEAEPNLKNKIQQFNDREIVFVAQGDEVDSETLGQPQGNIPPEEKVERMAKRAMKAREGINEGYEGKIEALLADLGIDGFFRDDVLYVDPDRLDDAEDALIYADEIYEIPEIKSKTELHKPGRDKYDRVIPNAFGHGSYGPKRFAEEVSRLKSGSYEIVKSNDVTHVKYKGKTISSGDFDQGADGWFMTVRGEKGQKFFDELKDMINYFKKNKITEGDPDFSPVKGRKVKTVNMTHKTSGKEVVVVDNPKKIKEMEKLGFVKDKWWKEEVEADYISEPVDNDAAVELKLYIDNDAQLYERQLVPIVKNIQRKMKRGIYDHGKVLKLWMYLVDNGARQYVKEFGGPGDTVRAMFDKETRELVAQEFADEYKVEIEAQGGVMFDHVELDEVEDPGRIGSDGGSEYKVVEYTRGGQGQVYVTFRAMNMGHAETLYQQHYAKSNTALTNSGGMVIKITEEVDMELREWTISDVMVAMKKAYGKVDIEAIEKLKKVQWRGAGGHKGNVDRDDLVRVGHGKLIIPKVDINIKENVMNEEYNSELTSILDLAGVDNNKITEKNPDETISPDEEEDTNELYSYFSAGLDDLISNASQEADRIGGEFRSPGIERELRDIAKAAIDNWLNKRPEVAPAPNPWKRHLDYDTEPAEKDRLSADEQ